MKRTPKDIMPLVIPLVVAIRAADNGRCDVSIELLKHAATVLLDMMDVTGDRMIDVPANTMKTRCASCGRTGYWVDMPEGYGKNNRILVDCRPTGCIEPSASEHRDGKGIAHFATCPDAKEWRQTAARQALAQAEVKTGLAARGSLDRSDELRRLDANRPSGSDWRGS
jgi:hypothetical protein